MNPGILIAVLGLAVLAGLALMRMRRGAGEKPSDALAGMDELLSKGRYAEAAALAARNERWTEAMDLYLRAQDPARAAQVAARMGNHRVAGELYEKAGDAEKAARNFEKAGLSDRAREVTEKAARKSDRSKTPFELGETPRREAAPQAVSDPLSRAREAEGRFRQVLLEAVKDPSRKAEAQPLAMQAAEEFLALGDIARAAAIYRDAELTDEAVHLYVNVLGQPGEAAPLVAQAGHHERAAELYELAGQKERAASTWADVARRSPHPEGFLDRVEQLSIDVARTLLRELVSARPPDARNAEVHYRYANVLEKAGEREAAAATFQALCDAIGTYRDVDARVNALRATQVARPSPKPPATPASAPTVVVQPVLIDRDVPQEEAMAMAREAAMAAMHRSRRSSLPPPPPDATVLNVQQVVIDTRGTRAVRSFAVGLEDNPIEIRALRDAAVKAAREGPAIDTLKRFIAGAPCSLGNIEVFYRMGLAHLASGDWSGALEAFRAVEEASPGYRDAELRVIELERWQSVLGSKVSLIGQTPARSDVTAGRYVVRGELGRGGMAVVYRAVDQVLGREVALKFLAEHFSANKEMREMFHREARSVGQLNHPGIVTIYDFGVLDERAFIAMEFVEGQTIDQMIETAERIPVIEALQIIKQVLEALQYAHERQIIHRDIKPSNMMRTSAGTVKLMDFGLAKSLEGGAKSSIVAGTPAYMPPEQFVGEQVDQRADLFAVGASLYEMITGQLPFTSQDRTKRPRPARELAPAVPEVIDRMLAIALEPDVTRRFQTAADFLIPVRRVLTAVARATSSEAPKTPAPHGGLFTAPPPPAVNAPIDPTINLGPTGMNVPKAPSTGSLADLLEPETNTSDKD